MKRFLAVWAMLGCVAACPAAAQQQRVARDTTARDSGRTAAAVRAPIDGLFEAMRAGDSTAVRRVFASQARLVTALAEGDSTVALRVTPVGSFASAVGAPREATWDERVWNVEMRRDGPLAAAWVPYAFFVDGEMSHCGTNAVQLVRIGTEESSSAWRILQITDTRQSSCEGFVPAGVRSSEGP